MYKKLIFAAALLGSSSAAFGAVAEDQVRGKVISVRESTNEITLQIIESGESRPADVGTVQTYEVPEGTPIEYQIKGRLFGVYNDEMSIGDIARGDRVLLDFEEIDKRKRARKVRNEETTNIAAQNRVEAAGQEIEDRSEQFNSTDENASYQQVSDLNDDPRNQQFAARKELPRTASALPVLGMIGFGFALCAFIARATRSALNK